METFDGHVQLNRYDAEGLRYEMEENGNLVRFIFNQEREAVTEEDSTGVIRLIRGSALIARNTDAARTYYHYASDEMGSTTHIVDENGNVQNRYEYDAWGNLTAQEEAIPNRFKYTGQQLDLVTQQYYLRARFYNPVIARFTQEDPYRGDGLNLYAYCVNNPVLYSDPTGNVSQCVKDASDKMRQEVGFGREAKESTLSEYPVATGQNPPKPPMSWNEFQHANRGKWTRSEMSAEYEKYKATQVGPNKTQHYLHRPYIRQKTMDKIRSQSIIDEQGRIFDPIVELYMPGPYDIGHIPGREFRLLRDEAEDLGLSQSEFNNWVNDHPEWLFMQNRELNRSHLAEETQINTPNGQERLVQRALEILSRTGG